jgi:hypothetical protein
MGDTGLRGITTTLRGGWWGAGSYRGSIHSLCTPRSDDETCSPPTPVRSPRAASTHAG